LQAHWFGEKSEPKYQPWRFDKPKQAPLSIAPTPDWMSCTTRLDSATTQRQSAKAESNAAFFRGSLDQAMAAIGTITHWLLAELAPVAEENRSGPRRQKIAGAVGKTGLDLMSRKEDKESRTSTTRPPTL
jgi:hypothetical protein